MISLRWLPVACLSSALALVAACSSSGADVATAAGGKGGASAAGGSSARGSGGSTTGGSDAGGSENPGGAPATGGTATGGSTTTGGTASDAGAAGDSSTGTAGDTGAAGTNGTGTVPYANVMGVMTSGNDGDYTFNVTIESEDIDCSQYASWWEVLTEDGTLIYRRILEHSHTDANGTSDADAPGNTFTRSGGPAAVAAGDVVIVRAHMSVKGENHGYNGRVMRGSASAGFVDAPEIGSDFAAAVESEDPQPTSCEF